MKYREASFAIFGLGAGAASFVRNGFTPGFRVAASAVLQPLNSYTRFPEYHFLDREIAALLSDRPSPSVLPRLLDIGSPKLFGFHLARRYPVTVVLTDISPLNIEPYKKMWTALRSGARGRVVFETRDARRLTDPDDAYDAVYAMSVLEHIEGTAGDTASVEEMIRVTKPGGLLAFSVPFGPVYQEQTIRGIAHAVERTERDTLHFFQRIYDPVQFERRLRRPLLGRIDFERVRTIDRRPSALLRGCHFLRGHLPESILTGLGFLNPFLSLALNRDRAGVVLPEIASYGPIHRFGDIFADLVYAGRKAPKA
ncbi:MAG: class I SAM-dependent methyltransferase [Candidatus Aminicenantes bacterium]|nr:class I SAM-dependent methyltransferase [Candidatus Aminicenantes bacterium]